MRNGANNSIRLRAALLATSLLSAPVSVQGAWAQPTAEDHVEPAADHDIIVVGNKMGSRLDRAPVAAISLDSEALASSGVQTIRDSQAKLPSVVYNDSGGAAQVYIRGIGTNTAYTGLESSVGTYQDGVYIQRQVGASLDVLDLDSLQVLYGPQGSLYGRNATGGVILVNTKNPVNAFEGKVSATAGSYGRADGEAMLNTPLSDSLSFRIAAKYAHNDGYLRDIGTGNRLGGYDSGTARAKLKWDGGSGLTVIGSFEYHKEVLDPVARRILTSAYLCTACAIFGSDPSPGEEFYHVSQTKTKKTNIRYWAASLNIHYAADSYDWTTVLGVRDFNHNIYVDQDYAAPDLFNSWARQFGTSYTGDSYIRTRLGGPVNFLIGLSGEIDKDSLVGQLNGAAFGPLTGAANTSMVKLQSISPYAEADVDLPAQFKLTLGGRYNIDTKRLDAISNDNAQIALGAVAEIQDRVTFRNFTPRIVLSHEAALSTIYASLSKGVKSGGYSTPVFNPQSPLRPEQLTSYEFGIKAHDAANRIQVSGAAFYYDYKNIQVSFVDAQSGSIRAENAAKARVYGVELNASLKPVRGLTLSGGGLISHARFRDYPSAAIFCPASFASPQYPGCPAPTGGPGLVGGSADLSGDVLPRAPELTWSLGVDYAFPVTGGWTMTISLADRFTSAYDLLPGAGGPLGLSRQPPTHYGTASIGIGQADGGLSGRLFVTNLANEKYYLDLPTSAFGIAGSAAAPRMFGGSLSYTF